MNCDCRVCSDHRRWVAALAKDDEAKSALDELLTRLEAAETDNSVYRAILDGSWPSAKQQLEAALKRINDTPAF